MNAKSILPFGNRTFIMGIINLTPDSFSGDGLLSRENAVEAAAEQAIHFVEDGADILDLGAESTRPGASRVEPQVELARLLPALKRILTLDMDVLISIDTSKAIVAHACLEAGAHIINDVWGLKQDADLAAIVAHHSAPVILMHNRSNPDHVSRSQSLGNRYMGSHYQNLMQDIAQELQESVQIARQAGITDNNIIIDPGIGFGKSVEQNMNIIKNLGQLKELGYPILLGSSRKSFIGYTLDLPPEERLEGTAATVALGIANGADIVRVHDVKEMSRVARMCDAILQS
ncbi:MAG TPA: dihydropteroate synthase [Anaerolineaceae bacterium]|nr:dihydropteroate synthase [Anaerolineaceae bacterium]